MIYIYIWVWFPIWLWINTYKNTIFREMNIHKSQLFWCEICELQGYYWFWHTAICRMSVSTKNQNGTWNIMKQPRGLGIGGWHSHSRFSRFIQTWIQIGYSRYSKHGVCYWNDVPKNLNVFLSIKPWVCTSRRDLSLSTREGCPDVLWSSWQAFSKLFWERKIRAIYPDKPCANPQYVNVCLPR